MVYQVFGLVVGSKDTSSESGFFTACQFFWRRCGGLPTVPDKDRKQPLPVEISEQNNGIKIF
jgi:hypothetical protein